MDVMRAPAVAVCRGRSDSTQKLDSTGDLREGTRPITTVPVVQYSVSCLL